jgi:AraC family transcriptional regulator
MKLSGGCFYGEVLQRRSLGGFVLVETRYAPGQKLSVHSHEHACFCFVLQGGFIETYGKRERSCQASSLIYRPSDESHLNQFQSAGGRCFNIAIEPRWLERVRQISASPEIPIHFRGGLLALLAMRLYREFRQMDEFSTLVIEGLALEMFGATSRHYRALERSEPRSTAPSWVLQARELIQARFSESLTLTGVAACVGVHPVHLARVFRRHYRRTLGEYVRQVRIEFASRELSGSDAPLAEVAAASGFSDQSHFSRTFKRLTGQTPAEFRKGSRPR